MLIYLMSVGENRVSGPWGKWSEIASSQKVIKRTTYPKFIDKHVG